MKICDTELQIIEGIGNVNGIRDKGGYLLYFPRIFRYDGQDQRYGDELAKQIALAEFILSALENYQSVDLKQAVIDDLEKRNQRLTDAMERWGWQHCTTEVELIEQIDSLLAGSESNAIDAMRDVEYFIQRLTAIKNLIIEGNGHMAAAKILADISALSGMLEKPIEVGSNVIVYDRHRLVIPTKAKVCRLSDDNESVLVEIDLEDKPELRFLPRKIFVHKAQLRLAPDDAEDEDEAIKA